MSTVVTRTRAYAGQSQSSKQRDYSYYHVFEQDLYPCPSSSYTPGKLLGEKRFAGHPQRDGDAPSSTLPRCWFPESTRTKLPSIDHLQLQTCTRTLGGLQQSASAWLSEFRGALQRLLTYPMSSCTPTLTPQFSQHRVVSHEHLPICLLHGLNMIPGLQVTVPNPESQVQAVAYVITRETSHSMLPLSPQTMIAKGGAASTVAFRPDAVPIPHL
jgi:hypothetical protein